MRVVLSASKMNHEIGCIASALHAMVRGLPNDIAMLRSGIYQITTSLQLSTSSHV